MTDILLKYSIVLLLGAAAVYYYTSLKIREIAIAAVRKHCQQMNLQLLDQSVSLYRVRPGLSNTNLLTLSRRFVFEFTSTGDERYKGEIVLLGNQVKKITLQPHRMPAAVEHTDANY